MNKLTLKECPYLPYALDPRLADHPNISSKLFAEDRDGSTYVIYRDPLLANKEIECPQCFSTEFNHLEIIYSQHVEEWLVDALGYRLVLKWELDV